MLFSLFMFDVLWLIKALPIAVFFTDWSWSCGLMKAETSKSWQLNPANCGWNEEALMCFSATAICWNPNVYGNWLTLATDWTVGQYAAQVTQRMVDVSGEGHGHLENCVWQFSDSSHQAFAVPMISTACLSKLASSCNSPMRDLAISSGSLYRRAFWSFDAATWVKSFEPLAGRLWQSSLCQA